jgi:superfamily II DNA or RNA helicase
LDYENLTRDERVELLKDETYVQRGPFGKKKGGHLLYDLDIPALRIAESHDRMMGFWVVGWINYVKDSLRYFFKNGGTLRLIIGVPSSKESYELLIDAAGKSASKTYKEIVRKEFLNRINNAVLWADTDSSKLFMESVLSNRIEIKLRPENPDDERFGIHPEHSKMRIFRTGEEIYALSGSANDTRAALFGQKEFSSTSDVTWSPDPATAAGAIATFEQFELDWTSEHSVNLDSSAISKLEDLQKKYQSSDKFEEDFADSEHKHIIQFLKKVKSKNESIFFILNKDVNRVKEYLDIAPTNFDTSTIQFVILGNEDPFDMYVYKLFSEQFGVKFLIYDDSEGLGIEGKQGISPNDNKIMSHSKLIALGKKINPKSQQDTDSDILWSAIFNILGLEIPEFIEKIMTDHDTTNEENEYWGKNYFQYLYDKIPGDLNLHDHQKRALDGWINNNHRGILQHATGTYKTATGLCAAAHLLSNHCNLVIISSPYQVVSSQWLELSKKCFKDTLIVPCWGDSKHKGWQEKLEAASIKAREGSAKVLAIFVENSLFGKKKHRNNTSDLLIDFSNRGGKIGLVADEMHNWISYSEEAVSTRFMKNQSEIIEFRLGLSAKIDVQGKECYPQNVFTRNWLSYSLDSKESFIDNFFLKDAIDKGYLRKYQYEVVKIDVSIPEQFLSKYGPKATFDEAINKFYTLATQYAIENVHRIIGNKDTERLLVYTGPKIQHAEELVQDLTNSRPWYSVEKIKKFTSDETSRVRENLLNEFKNGQTKILVAIKCLDEGVNLPIADSALMIESSKADDRQWVQRRGRILRKIAGESKFAKIIDFHPSFIGPALTNGDLGMKLREKREFSFKRIQEFAKTAELKSRLELSELWGSADGR